MPDVLCRRIPESSLLDPKSILADGVRLVQAWLPAPQPGFRPAYVVFGWSSEALFVAALLADGDVFTKATEDNQRMWELGDALEIFLGQEGSPGYVELHITPNNKQLRLRFPDSEAVAKSRRTGDLSTYLIAEPCFQSSVVSARSGFEGWIVTATIPSALVTGRDQIRDGEVWQFSVCRYDASRGAEEPVLSSTSSYTALDFHRRLEWGTLRFVS